MSSVAVIILGREVTQISPFGLSDAIPHCVDHEVQTKNPQRRGERVPGNETSGGKEILSGLGIRGDWDGGRSCTFTHGDSPEICGEHGGGDLEEEYEPGACEEVSFPRECLLGPRRDMVERIFRLDGRDQ